MYLQPLLHLQAVPTLNSMETPDFDFILLFRKSFAIKKIRIFSIRVCVLRGNSIFPHISIRSFNEATVTTQGHRVPRAI